MQNVLHFIFQQEYFNKSLKLFFFHILWLTGCLSILAFTFISDCSQEIQRSLGYGHVKSGVRLLVVKRTQNISLSALAKGHEHYRSGWMKCFGNLPHRKIKWAESICSNCKLTEELYKICVYEGQQYLSLLKWLFKHWKMDETQLIWFMTYDLFSLFKFGGQ